MTPPFRLLDLPPQLRNLVYTFVAAEFEGKVVRRIANASYPHGSRRVRRIHAESMLNIVLTNKQIHKEALPFILDAVHGEVYWEAKNDGLSQSRPAGTLNQIDRSLNLHQAEFATITHLNLCGPHSESLLQFMAGDPNMVRKMCLPYAKRTQHLTGQLRTSLVNLQALTVYHPVYLASHFRRRASKESYAKTVRDMFPKLRLIYLETTEGVEVVWSRSNGWMDERIGRKRKFDEVG